MSSKFLYKHKWLSLKETKHHFIYAQRDGINSTATLCFRKVNNKYEFLIRYQPLQDLVFNGKKHEYWKDLYPCPITGSLHGQKWKDNVLEEVYEEGGYKISSHDIVYSTKAVSSTQMNEIVYVCLVEITNHQQYPILGDGSHLEKVATVIWRDETYLKKILLQNKEIYLSTLSIAYMLFLKHVKRVF